MGFGKILRTLRTTAGLSLRELARELEVSPAYLSLIETGKSPPPVEEKIHRLEHRLGVPPGSLLIFTDRHPRKTIEWLQANPEAARFMEAAMEHGLADGDFELMRKLLALGGRQVLMRPLEQAREVLTRGLPAGGNGDGGSSLLGRNFLFLTSRAKNGSSLLHEVAKEVARRHPELKAREIARGLVEREESGSTAMGGGLAIPHATLETLTERIVALVKIPEGADFGAADRQAVTLAFVILGPEDARAFHVYLLARIARFFLQPGLRERLMDTETKEEAIAVLNEMDDKTP